MRIAVSHRDQERTAGFVAVTLVIAAKILRSFFRDPQVFLPTLLQGVLFLLLFRYVFGGAIGDRELEYVDYLTPGIAVTAILFVSTQAALAVAQEKTQGFTDRMLSLPVRRIGITAGRVVAHGLIGLVGAATTVIAAFLMGFRPHAPVLNLIMAGCLLALYSIAFAAVFVALGSSVSNPQAAQSLAFIAIPLTLISSAIVPSATMPSWLAFVADHQPLTPMIDALRHLTQADQLALGATPIPAAVAWALSLTLGAVVLATNRLVE
ncbi:ABC transporter, permease protein [Leucobacter sp. 7(1)]|uniref:ABC transporter permease n=1 Tax=Leucobacter sp. 7(1) TaxID=1255613 RepID=UPI00097EB631|nr:ABC transporter permease [Leucobacter sp. 7(1)]SJN11976.1 ABC transporter, permease protein [Leucobacter sp. 7(1)]